MADIEIAKREIDRGLRLEEGERLKPYPCEAGVPTIGVGATTYLDGRKVKLSDTPITREQMDRMLAVEIDRYVAEVMEMVDGIASTMQLVALVLCGYNIGLAALRGSSMIRLHRAGDYIGASRAFRLWNKYRKVKGGPLLVHPVLDARRAREAGLYMTPDADDLAQRLPQAVAEESKLTASPIAQGGAVTAGTGILAGAAQLADQINENSGVLGSVKSAMAAVKDVVHGAADLVGVPPGVLLAAVLVIAGIGIVNNRRRQRKEGWA